MSNRPRRRAVKRGVLVGAALGMLGASSPSRAQELWLVPDAFAVASGSSTAATARVTARGSRDKAPLRVRHRPRRPGQYVVAGARSPYRTHHTDPVR